MPCLTPSGGETSRLALLLEHFARVEDPRGARRVTHPLAEVLLLVACGTMADCDDCDHIAAWGETHLEVLRRHLPYADGVPGGRWLTILMNRINPALFGAAFTAWVREAWPDRPEFLATDGKTSRRSHDRASGAEPLHLVSAFAAAPPGTLKTGTDADKGHGRIETRSVSILHQVEWLKRSIKLRRKLAGWSPEYVNNLLNHVP